MKYGRGQYCDLQTPIGLLPQSSLADGEYVHMEQLSVGTPASIAVTCGVVAGALNSYYKYNVRESMKYGSANTY